MAKTKPPIILLHGFRGAPIGLEAVAANLRNAGYQICAPAVPPFAGAESLPSYNPESYANFVKTFIEENHLDRPILIGHSMASLVVSSVAERYPELINKKLVLLSPLSQKPPMFIGKISPLSAYLPRKLVDYVTTKFLFIPKDKKLFKKTLGLTNKCSSATNLNAKRSDIVATGNFSSHHSVKDFALNQEILIVAGESDRIVKQSSTKSLARDLNAELVLLPKSGHLHNYEQPKETSNAILKFLQK